MKLLLLCVGLSLVCAHAEGDVVRSNIDISKISGEWYSILVASDAREKIEDGGSMRVFIEHIEALENSSLLFVFHVQENGKCIQLTLVADQTEEDGVYSVGYDGHNVFRIVETDYGTYIIFYLTNFSKNKTFRLIELYGREPDVSPKLKEHFVKYCQEHGIAKENMIDLTKVDRCLQARGSEGAQASSAE